MYRFTDRAKGIEVSDAKFERLRRIVTRYYIGTISGAEFERLMREEGFTRARAFDIYFDILEGRYERVRKIKFIDVLVSVSLRTTSSKGSWSERYFEGWLRTAVPYAIKDEAAGGDVYEAIFKKCAEIDYLGDLYLKCLYTYFESKGYDNEMLDTAEWYAGVKFFEEYMDFEDRDIVFVMDIFDKGSASRPMSIHRWHDEIPMIKKYWEDLVEACLHFRKEAFKRGYTKSMGKGVRW